MQLLWFSLITCLACAAVPNCLTPSTTNTVSSSTFILPSAAPSSNAEPTSQAPALMGSDAVELLKLYQIPTLPSPSSLPATATSGPVLRTCSPVTICAQLPTPTNEANRHIETTFEGQAISFDYYHWTLIPESVCRSFQTNSPQFSACNQAAEHLFQRMCDQLPLTPDIPADQLPVLTQLYCQAAQNMQNLQTTVEPSTHGLAQISISHTHLEGLQALRQSCNDFILKAMIAESFHNIRERDSRCAAYYKALDQS